jgi:hypothetical protein
MVAWAKNRGVSSEEVALKPNRENRRKLSASGENRRMAMWRK